MILLDSGPLYAAFDGDDEHHAWASDLIREHAFELAIPEPVLLETSMLAQRRQIGSIVGPLVEQAFTGPGEMIHPTAGEWLSAAQLVTRYADLPLDIVDALLVAIAEARHIRRVLTTDQRDFRVVRPRHVAAFDLIGW